MATKLPYIPDETDYTKPQIPGVGSPKVGNPGDFGGATTPEGPGFGPKTGAPYDPGGATTNPVGGTGGLPTGGGSELGDPTDPTGGGPTHQPSVTDGYADPEISEGGGGWAPGYLAQDNSDPNAPTVSLGAPAKPATGKPTWDPGATTPEGPNVPPGGGATTPEGPGGMVPNPKTGAPGYTGDPGAVTNSAPAGGMTNSMDAPSSMPANAGQQIVPGATTPEGPGFGGPAPYIPPGTGGVKQPTGGLSPLSPTTPEGPGFGSPAGPANAPPSQDRQLVDNEILKKLLNGDNIDMNNPAVKAEGDAYAAAQERSRRNAVDSGAEQMAAGGMGSSGANDVERRMANENASQSSASFEGQLAMNELTNKRAEYQSAMEQATKLGMADQATALQQKIADMDNTMKQQQLSQAGQLGNRSLDIQKQLGDAGIDVQKAGQAMTERISNAGLDVQKLLAMNDNDLKRELGNKGLDLQQLLGTGDLDLRRALGQGGLNLDTLRALLQDSQFNKQLGFEMGSKEADLNGQALRDQMGI